MSAPDLRTTSLAGSALVAFAANSVLARVALGAGAIDAASYATIRVAAGALALALLLRLRAGGWSLTGTWRSAAWLALYAAPFAFAYLELPTGTGALILFGSVQVTMITAGLAGGERPDPREWVGLGLALLGLVWLVLPGVGQAPVAGAVLMAVAGVAWGAYSLRGRRVADALADTGGNFLRATPLVLAVSLVTLPGAHLTAPGLGYAVASGAVASGLGYVIWYAALPRLTATRAATIQLAVPVLAAWAGVVLLHEAVTLRLVLSGAAILGGVGLAVLRRSPPRVAR
jgi:drug/metabolite transporter (DMT)-like permease